jgi:nucleotide-binding universal stress UspA family protein
MNFERVLVGNDGSAGAMGALRLARRLASADAEFLALTVAETHHAVHAGMDAVTWDQRLRADAEAARLAADRELRGTAHGEARSLTGHAAQALVAAIEEFRADLVAIGSHGHSRAAGIVLGSVATRLIHDAPCSVLIAREQLEIEDFPRSIVVGIDTSPTSLEAKAVAEALAARTGASVRRLTATGGKPVPENATVDAELDSRSAVDALVDASRSCDLLVVGSRGLHGLAALGSVAERVAHKAECSVLVVRARP